MTKMSRKLWSKTSVNSGSEDRLSSRVYTAIIQKVHSRGRPTSFMTLGLLRRDAYLYVVRLCLLVGRFTEMYTPNNVRKKYSKESKESAVARAKKAMARRCSELTREVTDSMHRRPPR